MLVKSIVIRIGKHETWSYTIFWCWGLATWQGERCKSYWCFIKHPNLSMVKKITVGYATLFNKVLRWFLNFYFEPHSCVFILNNSILEGDRSIEAHNLFSCSFIQYYSLLIYLPDHYLAIFLMSYLLGSFLFSGALGTKWGLAI
jgi:hypothetical protein